MKEISFHQTKQKSLRPHTYAPRLHDDVARGGVVVIVARGRVLCSSGRRRA